LNSQARRASTLPSKHLGSGGGTGRQQLPPARHDVFNWNGRDRVIVVGDVHGCADELENLLKEVEFARDKDVLVFVGDLVRKGPNSKRVVKIARELRALTVRGNHDLYAVEDTSNALGLLDEDLEYLRNAPVSITIPQLKTIIVHAGIVPGLTLDQNDPMAMVTMRNVVDKTRPIASNKEGVPWISLWEGPEHIIFGHDAKRGLQKTAFATGLDTGCVYGRSLTALVLPERRIVSVLSSMPVPAGHEPAHASQPEPARL